MSETTELAVEHSGTLQISPSQGVQDDASAIQAFLDRYRDCSENTVRAYAKEVRRFVLWLRWHFQSADPVLLVHANKDVLNQYQDVLAAGGEKFPQEFLRRNGWPEGRQPWARFEDRPKVRDVNAKPSAASIRHGMLILKLFFEHLQDEGYLTTNPARIARKTRKHSRQNVRIKEAFSDAELLHLNNTIELLPMDTDRDVAHYHRARWVVQLLYRSLLRREEAATLRMGDFVLMKDHWEIHLIGKGGKEAEIIASSKLVEELKIYRTSLGLPPLPSPHEDRPAIMDVHGKRGVSDDSIYRIYGEVCTRASLTSDAYSSARFLAASPHWLRHTGISHLMEAGIDPRRVQAQARHSSLNTTTSIYDHKERGAWAREMERLQI